MLEEGRRLYVQECQLCHGDAGTGNGALPNTPVHAPRGHTWHHPDGQLKELILGTLDYPGRTMPGFADKMTGSEVDAVLEYMKSNWPAELREAQEEISRNWLEQSRDESDQ